MSNANLSINSNSGNKYIVDSGTKWNTISTVRFENVPSEKCVREEYDKYIKNFTPGVKKVIYNPPATIVFFSDGSKTTSKCEDVDTFDRMTGFLLCIAKKYMGGERIKHTLQKNVYPFEEDTVVKKKRK